MVDKLTLECDLNFEVYANSGVHMDHGRLQRRHLWGLGGHRPPKEKEKKTKKKEKKKKEKKGEKEKRELIRTMNDVKLLHIKMARTFEFVLHFVGCVTVTVSPNQIIIIIIIIIIIKCCFFQFFNSPVALKNKNNLAPQEEVEMTLLADWQREFRCSIFH